MDKLSPEAQMKALEYLIAQDQLSKGSLNAGFFFAVFFAFIFGVVVTRLYSR